MEEQEIISQESTPTKLEGINKNMPIKDIQKGSAPRGAQKQAPKG